MESFPFCSGSYRARSARFDAQRTVNLYPEASGSGTSKSIAMLIGTPGLKLLAQIGDGPVRGMLRFSERYCIIVAGTNVFRIENSGDFGDTLYSLGVIPGGSSLVSMASNGTLVMLVDGSAGWSIDVAAATMTQIIDPSFTGADLVTFIDGYFVFNKPGTQQFQITNLYSTTIDPLNFASAEGAPDLLISLIALNRDLWLLGENSTEVFVNSGNPDFPFERIQGAFLEQGCAAKFSVAKVTDTSGAGTIMWLTANEAGQGMVVRTVGYQPQRISDHALEFAIRQYIATSRIDDAIAYTYQQEGHTFYVLTFPSASKTWVYDLSTELWHERAFLDSSGNLVRHKSNCHMFFMGKNIVGDFENSMMYEFDLDWYLDGTSPILRLRQCPHISKGQVWQLFHELWIDMDTGVGLGNISPGTLGYDPELILEWSDDGGINFPYSRTIRIGRTGQRKLQARARRLGKSQDRVFRVSLAEPVKCIFLGAGVRTSMASTNVVNA